MYFKCNILFIWCLKTSILISVNSSFKWEYKYTLSWTRYNLVKLIYVHIWNDMASLWFYSLSLSSSCPKLRKNMWHLFFYIWLISLIIQISCSKHFWDFEVKIHLYVQFSVSFTLNDLATFNSWSYSFICASNIPTHTCHFYWR